MPSPHQVIAALLAEVWPDRIGMASCVASGILDRLNEAGYTIAIMGEPERPAERPLATGRTTRRRPSAWTDGRRTAQRWRNTLLGFRTIKSRWRLSARRLSAGRRLE